MCGAATHCNGCFKCVYDATNLLRKVLAKRHIYIVVYSWSANNFILAIIQQEVRIKNAFCIFGKNRDLLFAQRILEKFPLKRISYMVKMARKVIHQVESFRVAAAVAAHISTYAIDIQVVCVYVWSATVCNHFTKLFGRTDDG